MYPLLSCTSLHFVGWLRCSCSMILHNITIALPNITLQLHCTHLHSCNCTVSLHCHCTAQSWSVTGAMLDCTNAAQCNCVGQSCSVDTVELLSAIVLHKVVQWTKLSWWVQCESVLAGEEAVITGHAVPPPFILYTQSSSSSNQAPLSSLSSSSSSSHICHMTIW